MIVGMYMSINDFFWILFARFIYTIVKNHAFSKKINIFLQKSDVKLKYMRFSFKRRNSLIFLFGWKSIFTIENCD